MLAKLYLESNTEAMTERMSIEEFSDICDGRVNGYVLFAGQQYPKNYDELVAFTGHRIGIDEVNFSVSGLSQWLLRGKANPGSCSPEIDAEHVETVILLGELDDRDEFVASLPEIADAVWLPPTNVIRKMIGEQNN